MPRLASALAGMVRRTAAVTRRIIGAPDYDRYLDHMRSRHPGRVPLARAEFERDRLASRYDRPGSRCC